VVYKGVLITKSYFVQDYHPPSHISFASHHDTEPFQVKKLPHPIKIKAEAGETIEQMMWPDHCVQGTSGCQFHKEVLEALKDKEEEGGGGKVMVVQKVSGTYARSNQRIR
jgi:nicotinamidase-related amidase